MLKNKMVTFIKKYFLFSLKSTIISLFLPVIIFFIACTGWISYQLAVSQLEENAYKNVNDTLFQTKGYLENRLSDVFEQLVTFSNDPRTLSIINSEPSNIDAEDYIEMSNLIKVTHLNYISIIDSVLVDMHHSKFTMYRSEYRKRVSQFPYKEYASRYTGSKEGFYWRTQHKDDIFVNNTEVVSVFKLIGNDTSKVNGVLLFNLRNDFFEKVLNKSLIGEHGYITLVSPDGILNSKNVAKEYQLNRDDVKYLKSLKEESGRYELQKANGEKMMVIYDTIGVNNWRVAAVFSMDGIVKKANYIKYVTIAVIFMLILTAIVIANFLARYITKPVSALVEQTKQINENNLQLKFDHTGPQEIEILNKALEELMVRINTLLAQIRLGQDEKRQLEFAVMHAQINPHFLYNTLYSIKGLSDMGLNKDASLMITALSNFFRISISKGQEIIKVEEELTHIKNYLVIQEMRYGDDFSYEIQVEASALSGKIVKLTLQPLIENAIYHGVKQKRGKGKIVIKGYEEGGNIQLEVIDNGCGISQERLGEIQKELSSRRSQLPTIGIGLRSVHERIQMHFGGSYGLVLESEEGKGTRAIVTIPKINGGMS